MGRAKVDGGCGSSDVESSPRGGLSALGYGEEGGENMRVMLRCFRVGFACDPSMLVCVRAGGIGTATLAKGSQPKPRLNGPYSKLKSESLSL